MKEFTYKIKPNDSHGFKGSAVIKIPKYKERLKLLKSVNLKFGENCEVILDGDQIGMAIKFAEIAEAHVKSIDISRGNDKFKSLEDLEYDPEGGALVSELGGLVVSGIKMGK